MGAEASKPGMQVTPKCGYRVLSVSPDGPAANCTVFPDATSARSELRIRSPRVGSLVAWLDILTSINGVSLTANDDTLANEIANSKGGPILLEIYNIKRQASRTVQIDLLGSAAGLGLAVAWVEEVRVLGAGGETPLHVTEVIADSPAQQAGLQAGVDYVLGSMEGTYSDVEEFGDDVSVRAAAAENSDGVARLPLYVYRSSTDSVRLVNLLVPAQPWGPDHRRGVGVGLACGQLHELPADAGKSDGIPEFHVGRAPSNVQVMPLTTFLGGTTASAGQVQPAVGQPISDIFSASSDAAAAAAFASPPPATAATDDGVRDRDSLSVGANASGATGQQNPVLSQASASQHEPQQHQYAVQTVLPAPPIVKLSQMPQVHLPTLQNRAPGPGGAGGLGLTAVTPFGTAAPYRASLTAPAVPVPGSMRQVVQ